MTNENNESFCHDIVCYAYSYLHTDCIKNSLRHVKKYLLSAAEYFIQVILEFGHRDTIITLLNTESYD